MNFFLIKLFDELDVSPKNLIFLKTFNSEFSYIEIWFTIKLLMKILNR